jgi:hypothetical protein
MSLPGKRLVGKTPRCQLITPAHYGDLPEKRLQHPNRYRVNCGATGIHL